MMVDEQMSAINEALREGVQTWLRYLGPEWTEEPRVTSAVVRFTHTCGAWLDVSEFLLLLEQVPEAVELAAKTLNDAMPMRAEAIALEFSRDQGGKIRARITNKGLTFPSEEER